MFVLILIGLLDVGISHSSSLIIEYHIDEYVASVVFLILLFVTAACLC